MSEKWMNPDYLRNQQYKDASNLTARAELHRRFSVNPQDFQRWVAAHVKLPAQSRVLELGGGPGWLWRNNIERIPTDWRVTLSDFSPGMVREARANLPAGDARFAFAVIDAQAIPFASDSLDAVVANHMLYHVPDRDRALAEIRRVLRPGGYFYAATVGPRHMAEISRLVRRFDESMVSDWVGAPFNLENAPAKLEAYFPGAELHHFEDDALRVTEVEPLVAYVCSGRAGEVLGSDGEKRAAFTAFVRQEIERGGGVFHVTKDTGLFVMHKPGA